MRWPEHLAIGLAAALSTALAGAAGADAPPAVAPVDAAAPAFPVRLADAATLRALRQGGFVLYLRHGPTDTTRADQAPVKLDDCATQRPLNDPGREVARRVGQSLRQAGIPLGDLHVSPMCRTRDTARLAFGDALRPQIDPLLMYTAHLTSSQKAPVHQRTRELLSAPVAAGTNRVLVGHAPTLADVMGYFLSPEGTLAVLRPRPGGFDYVASIPPDHWATLLRRPPP